MGPKYWAGPRAHKKARKACELKAFVEFSHVAHQICTHSLSPADSHFTRHNRLDFSRATRQPKRRKMIRPLQCLLHCLNAQETQQSPSTHVFKQQS